MSHRDRGLAVNRGSAPRHRPAPAVSAAGLLALLAAVASPAAATLGPPAFSKVFSPDTIGPGSTTTVVFTITNDNPAPVTDLAFSDTLPAAVTIAGAPRARTTCGQDAVLVAPAGGGTISLSGGDVGAMASCTVRVEVVGSTAGTHTNTTGDLTSSEGNSGTATDDLMVVSTLPGFSKAFAPSTVPLGGRSTLTFTIDNFANASDVETVSFSDGLPAGLVVADPANEMVDSDCFNPSFGFTLTAEPGSQVVEYEALGTAGFPAIEEGALCTISVDVVAIGGGSLGNVSGQLQAEGVVAGKASATLTATVEPLHLTKAFTDDPVPPGGTVFLQFTIENFNRDATATSITFIDDLGAALPGLAATGLPLADPCGAGSTLADSSTLMDGTEITLSGPSGGSLAPGASCTFGVALSVPLGAAPGVYTNTTTAVMGELLGDGFTGNTASDDLFVVAAPTLTKSFTDDPVGAGGSVTLEFTITDTSVGGSTDIAFLDELTDPSGTPGAPPGGFLAFPISVTIPPGDPCGPGSSLALVFVDGSSDRQGLRLTGGSLGSGASCTFSVTVDIPAGFPAGTYTNTTRKISATVGGETVTGQRASDQIVILGAPRLTKEFVDDPVVPGDSVTLRFRLTRRVDAPAPATDIGFTDDLTFLGGLTATGLPLADLCGPGNGTLTGSGGDTVLTVAGITLAADETCEFEVTLDVAASADAGIHTNTTSDVTATVLGETVTRPGASDDLVVAGLVLTKEFTDDPVLPGGTVTLEFTIDNVSATQDATGINFTDDLDATLTGLAVDPATVPTDPCGTSSSILLFSGDTFISFLGGELLAGESCTFSMTLDVPAGAATGTYANTTSGFGGTFGGSFTSFPNAIDDLEVNAELLAIDKEFIDDPVAPGGTVTLRFEVFNLSTVDAVTAFEFTDDLDAALSGLAISSAPVNDCGGMNASLDAGFFDYDGGAVAVSSSCVIELLLDVPGTAAPGLYPNETSAPTGLAGGLPVTGALGADDLRVAAVEFSKAFSGPVVTGSTVTLTFTLENLDAGAGVSALQFNDDLGDMLAGAVATDLPQSDVCGAGSQLDGTSFLTFTGGSLGPAGTCSFDVTVSIPAGAVADTYDNATSPLTSSGLELSDPATASLTVIGLDFGDAPDPTFPTLRASDGARHRVGGSLLLGAAVDPEADGQPSAAADGDDLAGADDEDGVAFVGAVVAGDAAAGVDVTASDSGLLNAWIDFNGDGDWADFGEQIFADQPLVAGVNALTFAVPANAAAGTTFARFRADTGGGLAPTGEAPDGEVEDYPVTIVAEADLAVTVTATSDPAAAHTVLLYTLEVSNAGPSDAAGVTVEQELPAAGYFLGAAPDVTCTLSAGVALSCDAGALAAGASKAFTVGIFIDGRFSGGLTTEATVSPDGVTDPNAANNEDEVTSAVVRARAIAATERDSTPSLAIVAKEAEETLGIVFADAAGGGDRDYSVTSFGYRAVALAEVPDFDDTPSPELAVLGFGFDGSVVVDVVDAESTALLGSYPVPGGPWVPIDLVAVPSFDGTPAPEIVVGLNNLITGLFHLVTLDAGSGAVLRDVPDPNGSGFLVGIDALGDFFGSAASEILAASADGGASFQQAIDPDGGGAVVGAVFTDTFPLNAAAADVGGSATAEGVSLLRDALLGDLVACPVDYDPPALLPLVFYDPALVPAPMAVVPDFAGAPAPELAVLGISGGDLVVETRDLPSGALVGASNLGAGLVPLGLAVHPSFAGAADPDVSVLFEPFMAPTEVSVFDASGAGPLFNFVLP